MKVHSTSGYQWRIDEGRAEPSQGQGMRIMGMKDCAMTMHLLENGPEHPRIQPRTPPGGSHPHTGVSQSASQLASAGGDNDLVNTSALELPGQQPDLPLAAAPFPS